MDDNYMLTFCKSQRW